MCLGRGLRATHLAASPSWPMVVVSDLLVGQRPPPIARGKRCSAGGPWPARERHSGGALCRKGPFRLGFLVALILASPRGGAPSAVIGTQGVLEILSGPGSGYLLFLFALCLAGGGFEPEAVVIGTHRTLEICFP